MSNLTYVMVPLSPKHQCSNRGPPKGYIDAIESRLHQLEAMFGAILLAAPVDARASSILEDLRNADEMSRGAIDRVNLGPFGPLARRANNVNSSGDNKGSGRRQVPLGAKTNVNMPDGRRTVLHAFAQH